MIRMLDHTSPENAEKLFALFQASYAVEAQLLGADHFPPLERTASQLKASETKFYGYWKSDILAAAVEILTEEMNVHIQSLVVDPDHFRQGIGSAMMEHVILNRKTSSFTVETGFDNTPARKLYEQLGFILKKDWMTSVGIRKVRYEKKV